MASYYVYYNNVDLTNIVRVRTVDTTVLPPRENTAITIWERAGSIYNAYRYGEREITLSFLILATKKEYEANPNIMEDKLNLLRNVFKAEEPKPLYLGTNSKYIYAVPEGEFTMTELRYDCYECTVIFKCHDPEYYGANTKSYTSSGANTRAVSNNTTLSIYNSGDASAYPIINVGINNSASFVQVENVTTGQKLLVGTYPTINNKTTVEAETIVLDDPMNSKSAWSVGTSSIDSNRGYGGTLKLTNDKSGLTVDTLGSGSSTWNGVSGKRNLTKALTNFSVKATMKFNSIGKNGDPTDVRYKDSGAISSGSRTSYYKVIAPSVSVKNSLNGTIIATLDKETILTPLSNDINEGYVYVSYSGGQGYCDESYLKKYFKDNSTTNYFKNMKTKVDAELRSFPVNDSRASKLLATIPANTIVRVHNEKENGFYKLYIAYNDKIGYIDESYLIASSVSDYVEYPEDVIIDSRDSDIGICEVYGYSASGTKLFKLCLSDDNKYYEFVKPSIDVGNATVLEDISSVPKANITFSSTETNIAHDYLEEGELGGWNSFYGELGIQRKDNKWQGWIYKIEHGVAVNRLMLQEQKVTDAPVEDLAYITIYMGAKDKNNMNGISISHITVSSLNQVDHNTQNVNIFKKGDELKLDCYNNKVYLNNKLFNDIDICSHFIELVRGDNTIKITSDDGLAVTTVLFNERYL